MDCLSEEDNILTLDQIIKSRCYKYNHRTKFHDDVEWQNTRVGGM